MCCSVHVSVCVVSLQNCSHVDYLVSLALTDATEAQTAADMNSYRKLSEQTELHSLLCMDLTHIRPTWSLIRERPERFGTFGDDGWRVTEPGGKTLCCICLEVLSQQNVGRQWKLSFTGAPADVSGTISKALCLNEKVTYDQTWKARRLAGSVSRAAGLVRSASVKGGSRKETQLKFAKKRKRNR